MSLILVNNATSANTGDADRLTCIRQWSSNRPPFLGKTLMLALLSLFIFFALAILFPLVFGELMLTSLGKLHLSPSVAVILVIAIFVGGLINIPIKSTTHTRRVVVHPLAVFGLSDLWPELQYACQETVIAVNVGGCLIPAARALYELAYLALLSPPPLAAVAIGCAANILVCYQIARPMPGIGIIMPGVISPIVAAGLALVLAPDMPAPIAFVSGVMGPLVGADLLHLKDIETGEVGVASIGGAGTFDGIILSGIVAAYLA